MESTYVPQPLTTYSFSTYGDIRTVSFFPDGKRIVTGGHFDGSARIWNLEDGEEDGDPLMGHSLPILSVAVSKTGLDVVTGGPDNKVFLWDVNNRQAPRVLFSGPDNARILSVAFNSTPTSPNLVASSGSDGVVNIWKVKEDMDSTPFKRIVVANTTISSIQFSQGYPNLIAIASLDKKARVYDAHSGLQKAEFDGGTNVILSLRWFPDGHRLAFGGDKTVRVSNLRNDNLHDEKPFQGHTQLVKAVAVSPQGRFIASGSNDKTLRFWDAVTRVQIGGPLAHPGPVNLVAFSPDGKSLLSVTENNQVYLWDTNYLEVEEGLERTRGGIARLFSFSSDMREELRDILEYEFTKIREDHAREIEDQRKIFEEKIAADEKRFEELEYALSEIKQKQDEQLFELRDALQRATSSHEMQFITLNNALDQVMTKQADDLKVLQRGMAKIMEKHGELHTAQSVFSTQQEAKYSDTQQELRSIQKGITDLGNLLKKNFPTPRS